MPISIRSKIRDIIAKLLHSTHDASPTPFFFEVGKDICHLLCFHSYVAKGNGFMGGDKGPWGVQLA